MDALKRSMAWDEADYGREYDLDLFMIVAVDDFNMGAMENKGLNIFNSKLRAGEPGDRHRRRLRAIEAIIAHEYFHNWTGNRITCRDWFQLCLKEGLTVFRDQQFSGDMRSRGRQAHRGRDAAARRASSARTRARWRTRCGPTNYIEINNFYTATVYEKGAEVIGMLRRLVGPETYAPRARPLLRAPRRPGLHHRGLAPGLRGRLRPRPRRSSRAGTPRPAPRGSTARETWDGRPLHPDADPGDAADARPAGQGAAGRSRSPTA